MSSEIKEKIEINNKCIIKTIRGKGREEGTQGSLCGVCSLGFYLKCMAFLQLDLSADVQVEAASVEGGSPGQASNFYSQPFAVNLL